MSRKPSNTVLPVTIAQVHEADVLVGRKRNEHYYVMEIKKTPRRVEVTTMHEGRHTHVLRPEHEVSVLMEMDCKCGGSGEHHSARTVGDKQVVDVGMCFGCMGKGYMSRTDALRNHNYWAHYARVSM